MGDRAGRRLRKKKSIWMRESEKVEDEEEEVERWITRKGGGAERVTKI